MTERLSPRMEQVVELVACQGLSYAQVASELGISEHTVRNYAEQIGGRLRRAPRVAMFWYFNHVMRPASVSGAAEARSSTEPSG